MTETQAPYTASITGGTFALKVRPTRCEVGEALYQEWCAAVDALQDTLQQRGESEEREEALRYAETAMVAYFTHKNGEWGKKDSGPCFACAALRKGRGE